MNQAVEKILWKLPEAHQKGPWSIEAQNFVSDLMVTEAILVQFSPQDTAADHYHYQHEILLGLSGDLHLAWQDKQGVRHEERLLRDDGKLQALVIAPNIPHVIINRSATSFGTMYVWNGIIDRPITLSRQDSLLS